MYVYEKEKKKTNKEKMGEKKRIRGVERRFKRLLRKKRGRFMFLKNLPREKIELFRLITS